MATTTIKDGFNGGSDNQLKVNSDGSINVDVTGGTIIVSNPSVGPTGVTAPIQATEIGGIDTSGNLQALKVDSTGALEVSGTFASVTEGFSNLAPGYPTQISVGTNSIQIFPINSLRKYAHIMNNSSNIIYIQYQSAAALNQGVKINPGTFFTLDSANLWLGAINAIGLVSSQLIDILEGE